MACVTHPIAARILLSLIVALPCACGGGGADLDALCRDSCAHALSCGWITDEAACMAECPGDTALIRADALEKLYACLPDQACTAENPGDACYVQIVAELGALPPHETYASACAELVAACGAEWSAPASVCEIEQVLFFTESHMTTKVLPCLDLACPDAGACLELEVLDAI